MAFAQPHTQPSLITDGEVSYILGNHSQGMTLTTITNEILFKVNEPVLLAQGTIGDNRQIHLAYITNSSELCYTIISPSGEQQTMPLGKVDTTSQRFDKLFIFPFGKIIHIFYASSHITLPDVWRITHLFWNGQAWKSAQLGEIVHPHRPLFQVLIDSRFNLHVLMLTFLGSRSVLLTSIFNGSFFLWSKRQEVLNISQQVVDMTALMTENDQAFLYWAARQPSSDRFEIRQASQNKVTDFKQKWNLGMPISSDLHGPWVGMGAMKSQSKINLFAQGKQAILFHEENSRWIPQEVLHGQFPLLHISQKGVAQHYTFWGQSKNHTLPLFAEYLGLPNKKEEIPPNPTVPTNSTDLIIPEFKEVKNEAIAREESASHEESVPIEKNLPLEEKKIPEYEETSKEEAPEEVALEELEKVSHLILPEKEKTSEHGEILLANPNLPQASPENSLSDNNSILTILQELLKANQENAKLLQEVIHKINSPTQYQVAEKKGFWQRWFT
ncbi:MAG: hypothetical protein GX958_06670 [Desulfitobacterium sp.]|nr:hypothetical protein [Desulfitobacterium sp.]